MGQAASNRAATSHVSSPTFFAATSQPARPWCVRTWIDMDRHEREKIGRLEDDASSPTSAGRQVGTTRSSTNSKPKRDCGIADRPLCRGLETGPGLGRRHGDEMVEHDSRRCSSQSRSAAALRDRRLDGLHSSWALGASEDYRTPAVPSRLLSRRKPGQALRSVFHQPRQH